MRTCPVQITRFLQGGCVYVREGKRSREKKGLYVSDIFYDVVEMQMNTCSVQVSRWYRRGEQIYKNKTPGIYVIYIVYFVHRISNIHVYSSLSV